MTTALKWYQKFLGLAILLICGILFIIYSRTAFATFTDRPGFYGNLHNYYKVDRNIFGIYNSGIGLLSLLIIILQFSGLIKNKKQLTRRGNWFFAGLALLLIVAEIYLQTNFQGKG